MLRKLGTLPATGTLVASMLLAGAAAATATPTPLLEETRVAFSRDVVPGTLLAAPEDVRGYAVTTRNGHFDLVACRLVTGSLVRVEGRETGHGVLVQVWDGNGSGKPPAAGTCLPGTKVFLEPGTDATPMAKWLAPEEIQRRMTAEATETRAKYEARSHEIGDVVRRVEAAMPVASAPATDASR